MNIGFLRDKWFWLISNHWIVISFVFSYLLKLVNFLVKTANQKLNFVLFHPSLAHYRAWIKVKLFFSDMERHLILKPLYKHVIFSRIIVGFLELIRVKKFLESFSTSSMHAAMVRRVDLMLLIVIFSRTKIVCLTAI